MGKGLQLKKNNKSRYYLDYYFIVEGLGTGDLGSNKFQGNTGK
jgi:hypothetical protein